MRQRLVLSFLFGLLVAGCGAPNVAPTVDPGQTEPVTPAPVPTEAVTPVPGAPSQEQREGEVIVGGIEVDTVPGAAATPALDQEAALQIVAGELAAGRATMIGNHADSPAMHAVDAAFVPGLVRVISPAGGTDFSAPEPLPAWVVVSEGRGSDGLYISVGIVGQDGHPVATYVITPGVG